MKLIFKADRYRIEYWSDDMHLKDRDTVSVPPMLAQKLLKSFPRNFEAIAEAKNLPLIYQKYLKEPKPDHKSIPKVDIIIPTYNRPQLLQKAVDSVLYQSCPDWQLWIYDDGSDYDATSILIKHNDRRIYLRQGRKLTEQERSAKFTSCIARNILLDESSNPIIMYLDDDNYLWLEAVEKVIEYFKKNPEKDVVFGKLTYSDDDSEELPREERKINFPDRIVEDPFCKLDTSQLAHRRKCLKDCRWPANIKIHADGYFFSKLAEKYTFYPADIWLANYYEHPFSIGFLYHQGKEKERRRE